MIHLKKTNKSPAEFMFEIKEVGRFWNMIREQDLLEIKKYAGSRNIAAVVLISLHVGISEDNIVFIHSVTQEDIDKIKSNYLKYGADCLWRSRMEDKDNEWELQRLTEENPKFFRILKMFDELIPINDFFPSFIAGNMRKEIVEKLGGHETDYLYNEYNYRGRFPLLRFQPLSDKSKIYLYEKYVKSEQQKIFPFLLDADIFINPNRIPEETLVTPNEYIFSLVFKRYWKESRFGGEVLPIDKLEPFLEISYTESAILNAMKAIRKISDGRINLQWVLDRMGANLYTKHTQSELFNTYGNSFMWRNYTLEEYKIQQMRIEQDKTAIYL